jgi:hypothetical protein
VHLDVGHERELDPFSHVARFEPPAPRIGGPFLRLVVADPGIEGLCNVVDVI